MRNSGNYYGVLVKSVAGAPFLAYCGSGESPMLFSKFAKAAQYRRELKEHLKSDCRVVRVRAEFSVLTRV